MLIDYFMLSICVPVNSRLLVATFGRGMGVKSCTQLFNFTGSQLS